MNNLEQEALTYDLNSLIVLQEKRKANIKIFESAISNEKDIIKQEIRAQFHLGNKLQLHNNKIIILSDTDYTLIVEDLPKLQSTIARRNETISRLKIAIDTEQGYINREAEMILFLEKQNDGKN